MILDFSGLDGISREKHPVNTPAEPLLEAGEYKTTTKPKNTDKEQIWEHTSLQAKADERKREKEQLRSIYNEYQHNSKASSSLITEITKGSSNGEDIYSLFLKAVKAISLMTSDETTFNEIEKNLIAVYGKGLQEVNPLQQERANIEQRLKKLRKAESTETSQDNKDRITRAIEAHEKELKAIKKEIRQTSKKAPE